MLVTAISSARVSLGRRLLAIVFLSAAVLILTSVSPESVAAIQLVPVLLVADSLGLGGVVAAAIVLAVLGWAVARRFPKRTAIAGGCLLAFPLLQWLSWDFVACKGPECNDLGLLVVWRGLALWAALPGLIMLVTSVFTLKKSRTHHGA